MDVEDVPAAKDTFSTDEACTSSSAMRDESVQMSGVEEGGLLKDKKFPFVCISEDEFACFDENCYRLIMQHLRITGSQGFKNIQNQKNPSANSLPVFYNALETKLICELGHGNIFLPSDHEEPGASKPERPRSPVSKLPEEEKLKELAVKIATGKARKRRAVGPTEEEISSELEALRERMKPKSKIETPVINDADWMLPASGMDLLPQDLEFGMKYCVYYDLWKRGFYLTDGAKFGCDFLVYEGNPGTVHSSFMCLIRRSAEQFPVNEMLTLSRLSRTVKKDLLLAVPGTDNILYVKISQWNENPGGINEKQKKRPATWDDVGDCVEVIQSLVGKTVVVEFKNDFMLTGTLHSVDQYLNMKVTDITVHNPEKYPYMISVKSAFIRGSVIRYVHLPVDAVDTQLLQDATRKEILQNRKEKKATAESQ
ncbi:hypothetical protein FO519_007653 [Halicephalobus sp. NKZ332]|nr:hypothetical protein FO519_007653 [Halicephalobus sp. NKZ332]